ncbi:MAG: sporulation protein YqfD [Oscillospiraceae bacterium]|jgi:similar to stage IV sporulation protein|nr:sporulation protein YqfD [Oscillospiraceae bacterium]
MLILWLYRRILGYVRFTANGGFSERFLNLCARGGITVFGARRTSDGLCACCMARDYKKLRPAKRKTGVKLRVCGRCGLPFFTRRYRGRIGFAAGFLLCSALVWFLSLHIWSIEIHGNTRVSSNEITGVLRELGFEEGVISSKVDVATLRQQFLLKMPQLSWAAVNIEGCRAVVDVREALSPPDSEGETIPMNIKAARDGRIISMDVLNGTAAAYPGDAVIKGDLLISGSIQYKTGQTGYVHAKGTVTAETERSFTVAKSYVQQVTTRTGKTHTRRVFTFLNLKIPLYLGSIKVPVEREIAEHSVVIGGVNLPVNLTTAIFYETQTQAVTFDEVAVTAQAREEISEWEEYELDGAEVVSREEIVESTEKGVKITIKTICRENIAVEELILTNGGV